MTKALELIGDQFKQTEAEHICLHYELWVNEEWFAKRLPEWCRDNFDVLQERQE